MCSSGSLCKTDPKAYSLDAYSNSKKLMVVGIAKDGHLLYGPYGNDGQLIDCKELDICNGKQVNGSYGYVFTNTYPYSIGCWGPAN